MRLGLGIGVPYGSGALNPDKLSLDLQFATDKTLTARKGPTPTFTRASGSAGSVTYFGPRTIIVNSVSLTQNSTTIGGRFYWTSPNALPETYDYQATYNGTRWVMRIRYWFDGESYDETQALAAIGSEWRPDLANWSGTAVTITPTSSYGIVKAADNEPRFDYDPVTLACKGLLIEGQSTNLALQSETFPLPAWVKTNVTISPNTLDSPSGTVSADTLIEDTATSFHYISQQFAKAASSLTYSFSVYYKNASGNRTVVLALTNGTTSGKAAIFTNSGTVTATNVNIGSGAGFTFVSASVESVGNGWYRASVVVTSDTSTRLDAVVYLNNSTTVISSYRGIMSGVYLWGAQLELGSFPTSYIPTTTTALQRSTEVCSITGSGFSSFNSNAGFTALCNFSLLATNTAGAMSPIAVNQSSANGVFLYKGITSSDLTVYHVSTNTSIGSITANFTNKAAMAYDGNSVVGVLSGGAVSVETGSTALSFTGMTIGSNRSSAHQMSGHIASIRYFKKRLPNAKLQSLTL